MGGVYSSPAPSLTESMDMSYFTSWEFMIAMVIILGMFAGLWFFLRMRSMDEG